MVSSRTNFYQARRTLSPLGLPSCEERAVQVGGEFRVESHVGKGTQVMAEIPVGEEAMNAISITEIPMRTA